jgi:fatty-acyl-CoA synthase
MNRPPAESLTYQDLIIRAVSRAPEAEALVAGNLRLTGRELHDRVARTVNAYRSLGLGVGSRLALIGGNSADYLVAQLAAAALGVTFTGLHPLASVPELAEMLRRLRPQALVWGPGPTAEKAAALHDDPTLPADLTFVSLGPSDSGPNDGGPNDGGPSDSGPNDGGPSDKGPRRIGPDLLALAADRPPADLTDPALRAPMSATASISFTGGTTGGPKGVVRSQRALACSLTTMLAEWDWPPELRFLALAPLTHATGSIAAAVLLRGGCVHVRPGFDVEDVYRQVAAEQITATFLVPTMIYRLLDRPRADGELASLRLAIYGASAMSATRLAEGIRRWGPVFMQLYGQVEAPNTISVLRIAEHDVGDPSRLASCGRPTLNVDVALMTPDGQPVPDGTVGEICVSGPLLMDGYLDDPVATAAAFRDGWLRTGDMAVRDPDGFLTIVDRIKDMIVSGGFNIFAGDVERALNGHPGVRECAVIGVPDDLWGESVLAYVVPAAAEPGDDAAADLIAHVRAAKGSAWAPKAIEFVPVLPLTGLGKPDKKALRARHWTSQERAVH